MIYQEMKTYARSLCGDKTVTKVTCGIFFTAVSLSDGSTGISFAFPYGDTCQVKSPCYCGSMTGRPASDFVELLGSRNLTEASIAVAVMNALTAKEREGLPNGAGAPELAVIRPTDTVGMVGNFGPLCAEIRSRCKELRIFELKPFGDMYPAWSEPVYLPDCDVVYITASSLVNNTLDGILSCCPNAREIILMGPTVVEMPEVFRAHGITILAGAEVVDGEKVHHMILEGISGHGVVNPETGLTRSYYHHL